MRRRGFVTSARGVAIVCVGWMVGCRTEVTQPAPVPVPAQASPAQPPVAPTAVLARNVILFVGDGMGLSTIAATRALTVGVDGDLSLDQFPNVALSRTADADHITADSASTMTAMTTGVAANSGVIGFDRKTERGDFNHDGDGVALPTILELAKQRGMKVGVVTTARVTHATPAACYAHVNDRDKEADIALQALPTDAAYNRALGKGIDLLWGGGRQFFVPRDVTDEEGDLGSRVDGRDLRAEFRAAGYRYVWNARELASLRHDDLPVLGLFEHSHMEYEHDRAHDVGGEPSLEELTVRAIELLSAATRTGTHGFLLVVEGGRIDHAHHDGNAWRALTDTAAFDRAIGTARRRVDEAETLILATADHSHTFTLGGYPLRPADELGFPVAEAPPAYVEAGRSGVLGVVYDLTKDGRIAKSTDDDGVAYSALGYQNGTGHRVGARVDPARDKFLGLTGKSVRGPSDPDYRQEATVPLKNETHAGEDVGLFGAGPGSDRVRGTLRNTQIFQIMKAALGL